MRRVVFQNEHFYHICNRGTDKREIFYNDKDYIKFLYCLRELNRPESIESLYRLNQLRRKEAKLLRFAPNRRSLASPSPLVDIICYSLVLNHYHFILRQRAEKGIITFMHKLGTSFTKHFNYKYERTGSLFQGTYKAIEIKTDSYLQYLSGYINGNAEIHGIANAEDWPWSSYQDYLGTRNGTLCNKNQILKEFKNTTEYQELTRQIISNARQCKNDIKQLLLE